MTTKQFPLVRAVLFDLDGTLIDSAPDLGAAADRLRTDRGLESLPLHAYRPLAGTGARGMLSVAFGITPEHPDFPGLREEFFSNYERCIHERTEVFAGVPELVATLTQQSMKWGVVTNKMTRFPLRNQRREAGSPFWGCGRHCQWGQHTLLQTTSCTAVCGSGAAGVGAP